MIIQSIISGGQNGADLGALLAAKKAGIPTGGMMPKGYRTLDGPRPEYAEEFGLLEHSSQSYYPRTFQNVKASDGTIRIAVNLESSGEKCTLKAINQYKKPYFDVHVIDVERFELPPKYHPKAAAKWAIENNIKVLNVAGNSEKTAYRIGIFSERYIDALIRILSRGCNERK